MLPSVPAVQTIHRILADAGIATALGGSGLLCSLGLVSAVRDWDLTTEAPLETVLAALDGYAWEKAPCGDPPFASKFRLAISVDGAVIDLMGGFSIVTETGTCRIPTLVAGQWEGVDTGSPEAWAVAYRLMQRHQKADMLHAYLMQNGAASAAVGWLLNQPLPTPVRDEVRSWPFRAPE